jgi:hypothetical protein
MKKLIIILGLALLIVSCKSDTSFTPDVNKEVQINDFSGFNFSVVSSSFTKTDLIEQKLQELYDLSLLMQLHPKFDEELIDQIRSISDSKIRLTEKADSIKINNLTQIGDVNIKSVSISEVKFSYEVLYNNKVLTDSILAIVKIQNIEIDGENFSATKIRFKKIED